MATEITEVPDELTLQIAKILRSGISNTTGSFSSSDKIALNFKLTGDNYSLWSRLISVEIAIRGNQGILLGKHLLQQLMDQKSSVENMTISKYSLG